MRIMGYTSLQCPDWEHSVIIACAADFVKDPTVKLPQAKTTEVAYNAFHDTVHPLWVHDTYTLTPMVLPSSLPNGKHVWFVGSTTISSAPKGETWLVGRPGDTITIQRHGYKDEFKYEHKFITARHYNRDGSLNDSSNMDLFHPNAWKLWFPIESIIEPDYGSIPGMDYVESLARFEERWDPQALTAKALDQYQGLSINTASYIKEIPTVISTLTDTIRSVKAATHGDIKQLASAYLGNKYGTQNTIRDTVDIIKYVSGSHRTCTDSLHGSASFTKSGSFYNVTVRDGCTIRVNPVSKNVFDSTIDALRQIDLLPSLENLWDVVPYSFVIDWMVPIGDILSGIDKSADLARLDIRDCFYSRLIEFQSVTSWGVCRRTHFARYSSAPVSPIGVDSYSSGNISNHFLETSALIVQRTK